jgi:Amt family ammonium transporter
MISMWFVQGRPDVGITLNGSLGGALDVTACCANISSAVAFNVGIITTVTTIALERAQLDDAVGAVPVHLCNGLWGTLSIALFDQAGFDAHQFGVQTLGTFSISLTAFVICFGIFKIVDLLVGLRASDTEQA